MYLLGFDIGSSFIKGTLLDSDTNEEIAKSKQPSDEMDVMSRQVGWAEQMPEIWWANLCTLTKNLLTQSKVEPQEIKGIGISYQMHGLVLIDKDYQVLRPCIIWSDGRLHLLEVPLLRSWEKRIFNKTYSTLPEISLFPNSNG
ncbi:MAG: hypothetical protein IPP49_11790 [Saprospiraceae bacterium]|nr:hypothetical protein [Saprospiraceae bacterium]